MYAIIDIDRKEMDFITFYANSVYMRKLYTQTEKKKKKLQIATHYSKDMKMKYTHSVIKFWRSWRSLNT